MAALGSNDAPGTIVARTDEKLRGIATWKWLDDQGPDASTVLFSHHDPALPVSNEKDEGCVPACAVCLFRCAADHHARKSHCTMVKPLALCVYCGHRLAEMLFTYSSAYTAYYRFE
jgi:hypothetical protein